jgi:hypothetical protein
MFSDSGESGVYYLGYMVGFSGLIAIVYRCVASNRWRMALSEMFLGVACISLITAVTGDWIHRIGQVRLAREVVERIGGSMGERKYLKTYDVDLRKAEIGDGELDAIIPYLARLPEVDVDAIGSAITPSHAASLTYKFPHCHIILYENKPRP